MSPRTLLRVTANPALKTAATPHAPQSVAFGTAFGPLSVLMDARIRRGLTAVTDGNDREEDRKRSGNRQLACTRLHQSSKDLERAFQITRTAGWHSIGQYLNIV